MTTLLAWMDIQANTIKDNAGNLDEFSKNKDLFIIKLESLKKQVDSALIWLKDRKKFG